MKARIELRNTISRLFVEDMTNRHHKMRLNTVIRHNKGQMVVFPTLSLYDKITYKDFRT
jgi:hypothetical protein